VGEESVEEESAGGDSVGRMGKGVRVSLPTN
jgi:hypothetical protein